MVRVVLALAICSLLWMPAGTADAARLSITEGDLTLLGLDTLADFSGAGFSVLGSSPFGTDTSQIFGHGRATFSAGLPNGDSGSLVLEVGDALCAWPSDLECGFSLTLTSHKLKPPPAQLPLDQNYVAVAPFTARGHLDIGAGFDVTGHGLLTAVVCRDLTDELCAFGGGTVLLYTFGERGGSGNRTAASVLVDGPAAVPEPSALAYILIAGASVLVARRRRPRICEARRPGGLPGALI